MLALSPARDLFASSTTKGPHSDYHHSPILTRNTSSIPILNKTSFTTSYPSSYRQQSFVETPAQRRARAAFLQQENRQGEKRSERVESWVRDQVQHSAFLVTAAKMSAENDKSVKGHKRRSSTSLSHRRDLGAFSPKLVPDEIVLGRMLKDSSNLLSSITEEEEFEQEPYILYSTPLPRYPTPAPYHNSVPSSPTKSPRSPVKPSHQRRLSDLEVIPEGLEE